MPEDITESTAGILYSNTDDTSPQPKDSRLEDSANTSNPLSDGNSALDKMFEARRPKDKDEDTVENTEANSPAPSGGTTEGEAKPKEGDKQPVEKPAADKPADKDKPAADATKPAAKPTEPQDKLTKVSLPPHAKPNTVKSFDEVKRIAREELAEKDKAIAAKEKEITELKAKLPKDGGLTPELQKEVEELRAFRRAYDYQNDSEFKKTYDEPLSANETSILKKLESIGFKPEQIAKAKQIGLENLDWKPIFEQFPQIQRSVDALLVDSERIKEKRAQALEAAKGNPQQYEEQRKKSEEQRTAADKAAEQRVIEETLGKTDWFKQVEVPADATAEKKAEIDAQNAFFKEQQERLKLLQSDNSPEMRGTLIASTMLAFQLQRQASYYRQKFEAADSELQKVRKASATRSSRTAAAPSEVPPPKSSPFAPGADAIDRLRAEQLKSE